MPVLKPFRMNDEPVLAAIAQLRTDLAQLRTDLTTVSEGIEGQLTRLRVDVMARLDRHEDKLGTIHDDITVAIGSSDRAQQVNDNTREEVRSLGKLVNDLLHIVRKLEGRVSTLEDKASGT